MVVKMSSQITNRPFADTRPFIGLWVFLGVWALLQNTFEPDQDPRHFLKIQAGLPSGLNLNHSLPIVQPQGLSGHAHKAVARQQGASRFCVLQPFWHFIRGRDG